MAAKTGEGECNSWAKYNDKTIAIPVLKMRAPNFILNSFLSK
jgi:hypothetical protein